MATVTMSEVVPNASALRAELKEWERQFAAANGGKKAGRGDIKNAPEIGEQTRQSLLSYKTRLIPSAAKYKEYSRLKSDEPATRNEKAHSKPIEPDERPKKRKHSPNEPEHGQATATPRKPGKDVFQTPSKTKTAHPSDVDPYDSPSVFRRFFSPSTHMQSSPLKTAIGPTPQRDGKALGLFDLLSESGGSTATPSATRIASVKGMDAQTPSKKRKTMDTIAEEDEEEEEDTARGERTPASSGKKYMLSALFATPTAWKYSSIVDDDTSRGAVGMNAAIQSPQTTTNPNPDLETPSFLRRSNPGLYGSNHQGANAGGPSPIPVRKPPQFVGKGLSQLVQGLRDMEEERLDDDLDVLQEIENGQTAPDVDVPDSQMLDSNAAGRTYKKKGQKRTTRMVRMKPVVAAKPTKPKARSQTKSPTNSSQDESAENDDPEDDENSVAVAETQTAPSAPGVNEENIPAQYEANDRDSLHSISEAEADPDPDPDSDPDYDVDAKPLGRTKSFSEKMKEAIGASGSQARETSQVKQNETKAKAKAKEKEKEKEKEEKGKGKKLSTTRKVNPEAHANYRSLKIRNRGGGRAGGRGYGRFRRR